MKKLFIIIFLLNSVLSQAQITDTICFSINDIDIIIDNGYTRVSLNSCSTTDEIGFPELPRLEL